MLQILLTCYSWAETYLIHFFSCIHPLTSSSSAVLTPLSSFCTAYWWWGAQQSIVTNSKDQGNVQKTAPFAAEVADRDRPGKHERNGLGLTECNQSARQLRL